MTLSSAPSPSSASAEAKPRATGILLVLATLVAISTAGMIVFTRNLKIRTTTKQNLASGLSLTKVMLNTPGGQIPEYIVRADTSQGWKLRLVEADASVTKRRPVSEIATTWNAQHGNAAPVAVNGGYFAYEGAAVGAVKIDNEWIRLPWKSRTAIGWNDGARPQIASMSAKASLDFDDFSIPIDNLNGRATPTTCALLTRRFTAEYTPQKGEVVLSIRNDKVSAIKMGIKVLLAPDEKLLVCGAQSPFAARVAALSPGASAKFGVQTTPTSWNDFSTILGGGPRLIQNGAIKITHVEEEFRPDVLARGPRTTIGIDQKGHLTIFVVEAWHDKIKGMTLEAVAAEIQRAGADNGSPIVDAINLDGGSSTTLWVKGRSVTHQSDLVIDSKIIEKSSERREVGVANAVLLERNGP